MKMIQTTMSSISFNDNDDILVCIITMNYDDLNLCQPHLIIIPHLPQLVDGNIKVNKNQYLFIDINQHQYFHIRLGRMVNGGARGPGGSLNIIIINNINNISIDIMIINNIYTILLSISASQ